MQNMLASIILRKAIATYVVTIIASIVMAAPYVLKDSHSQFPYNLGNQFVGWSFIYMMYIGVIISIYGNAVSLGIEWVREKWFVRHNWLAFFMHGVFGMALVIIFPNWLFALIGMMIALAYGGLDWWLRVKVSTWKVVLWIVVTPVLLHVLSWGVLQYMSPPMPPFTMEDAVAQATEGKGTDIDNFPKKAGRWQGMIDGYHVERVTSAEEIEKDRYIVTFTETWTKGEDTNSRYFSYLVMRSTMTKYKSEGETPPYENYTLKNQSYGLAAAGPFYFFSTN